jgi:membrane associated rhomboid family serine protease
MIPLHDDNPTRTLPLVTVAIVIACVLAFLWQLLHEPQVQELLVTSLGVIPAALLGDFRLAQPLYALPPSATLVTSMFLHGGWMHLIGNMWYLWIFGDNLEDIMGRPRFVAFYLLSGIGAAALQVVMSPDSMVPMIGASGAIAGVLGGYALMWPRARVYAWIPLGFFSQGTWLPAWVLLGIWFLMQFLSAAGGGGGVAWYAHIGGFVAGLALVRAFARHDPRRRVRAWD